MAKWINRRHPLSVIAFVPALRIHWCCGFDTAQDNGRPQLTDIVLSVAARGIHTEWECASAADIVDIATASFHKETTRGALTGKLLLLVLLACIVWNVEVGKKYLDISWLMWRTWRTAHGLTVSFKM